MRIEEGAGGLKCELECAELEQELVPLGAIAGAARARWHILVHVIVEGVEQEHLVGGDDEVKELESVKYRKLI